MYNVKILKYPTGWQYRIYSRPVGFCDNEDKDDGVKLRLLYDESDGSFDSRFYNPSDVWRNPFTGELETIPLQYLDDIEQKKERNVKSSMNRTINRVYHLARSNIWDWFITLTFNPEKVDSFNYEECVEKLQNWLIMTRRSCPGIRYIIVPEKHESGRFHFHGLLADCDGLDFAESGKFTKDGKPIYNIGKYRLGWSTATQVTDNEKVTKYLSKYITKDLCAVSFGKKRYWHSRNLVECEVEELMLECPEQQLMHIMSQAKYIKKVEGFELTTTYIEMGDCDV